ncbi:MAG TPA: CDP-diacylglycerol--glycerol-3-phosphate 3-phosphatidyltransferase [Clostridiales bacterium]|nr:CDP-diacylglycerol--glycerol-3-phosphate 3-phosphatidyltransferase [Clostridiales bacterium]
MNLPNKLSLSRLIITPIMMFFYLATFISFGKFVALGLFIIGAFTDFLDGHIARKYNLVTDMGKFLDPIADKLLVTSALILVAVDGTILAPFGAIVLAIFVGRDLAVDMLRLVASSKGTVIAADKLGKYKTFSQDIALPLLILYSALNVLGINSTVLTVFMWISYGFLILATLLTIISLINYLIKNRAVFEEKM